VTVPVVIPAWLIIDWLVIWLDRQQGAQCRLRIEGKLYALVLVLVPSASHASQATSASPAIPSARVRHAVSNALSVPRTPA
jgi:hypothetical protein